jgi:hypothetical protein
MRVLFLLIIAISLIGCAGAGDEKRGSSSNTAEQHSTIKPGASKKDIRNEFGEPEDTSSSAIGEIWLYKIRGSFNGSSFIKDFNQSLVSLTVKFRGNRVDSLSTSTYLLPENVIKGGVWTLVNQIHEGPKWLCIYEQHGIRKTVITKSSCASTIY